MTETTPVNCYEIPASWLIAPDADEVPTIWEMPGCVAVINRRVVGAAIWGILAGLIPVGVLDENLNVVLDDDGKPMTTQPQAAPPLHGDVNGVDGEYLVAQLAIAQEEIERLKAQLAEAKAEALRELLDDLAQAGWDEPAELIQVIRDRAERGGHDG